MKGRRLGYLLVLAATVVATAGIALRFVSSGRHPGSLEPPVQEARAISYDHSSRATASASVEDADHDYVEAAARLLKIIEDGGYFGSYARYLPYNVLPPADIQLLRGMLRDQRCIPTFLEGLILQCGSEHPFTKLVLALLQELRSEDDALRDEIVRAHRFLDQRRSEWLAQADLLDLAAARAGKDNPADLAAKVERIPDLIGDRRLSLGRRLSFLELMPVFLQGKLHPSQEVLGRLLTLLEPSTNIPPLIRAALADRLLSISVWSRLEDERLCEQVLRHCRRLYADTRLSTPGLGMGLIADAAKSLSGNSRVDPMRWRACADLLLQMCLDELTLAETGVCVLPELWATAGVLEWQLLHAHFAHAERVMLSSTLPYEARRTALGILWPVRLHKALEPRASEARIRALRSICSAIATEPDDRFRRDLAYALVDGYYATQDKSVLSALRTCLSADLISKDDSETITKLLEAAPQ